ncbi:hypothetical protein [Baaleninema simplex]|uniref:hypothetical protein n=1 Tax=Baaleninema simplex TaxID=2862350 RepID=UPI00178C5F0C|nr:hypothetical protein [Baaleninema simplex]
MPIHPPNLDRESSVSSEEEEEKTTEEENNISDLGVKSALPNSSPTQQSDEDTSLVAQIYDESRAEDRDFLRPLVVELANNVYTIPPEKLNDGEKQIVEEAARDAIPRLLKFSVLTGITQLEPIAYIIATAEHESYFGATLYGHNYMYEYSGERPGSQQEQDYFNNAYGGRNGNDRVNDGYKYRGRGFVQITGEANYDKMQEVYNRAISNPTALERQANIDLSPIDLVNNPDIAADDRDVAARIAVLGMQQGIFRPPNNNLPFFFRVNAPRNERARRQRFENARQIVNPDDRAGYIAGRAEAYYQTLTRFFESGYLPSSIVEFS